MAAKKKFHVRMPSITVIARWVQAASASVSKSDVGEEGCDSRLRRGQAQCRAAVSRL